jgi:drug/metabolite transporter (DMT)-like permease
LILLMEPVFAGLAGYVDGERLGTVEIFGAVVILAAIAIAELGPRRSERRPRRVSRPVASDP